MRVWRLGAFFLGFGALAACGSSFTAVEEVPVDGGAGSPDASTPSDDAAAGMVDGAGPSDATLNEDATISPDAALDGGSTDGASSISLSGTPTGLAYAAGNLYYATTTHVLSCALPACTSFTPLSGVDDTVYQGLAPSFLTNGPTADNYVGWLTSDGGSTTIFLYQSEQSTPLTSFNVTGGASEVNAFAVLGDQIGASASTAPYPVDSVDASNGQFVEWIRPSNSSQNLVQAKSFVAGFGDTAVFSTVPTSGQTVQRPVLSITAFVNGSAKPLTSGSGQQIDCPDAAGCVNVDRLAGGNAADTVYAATNGGVARSLYAFYLDGGASYLGDLAASVQVMRVFGNTLVWLDSNNQVWTLPLDSTSSLPNMLADLGTATSFGMTSDVGKDSSDAHLYIGVVAGHSPEIRVFSLP